jgi:hypothetical protein
VEHYGAVTSIDGLIMKDVGVWDREEGIAPKHHLLAGSAVNGIEVGGGFVELEGDDAVASLGG